MDAKTLKKAKERLAGLERQLETRLVFFRASATGPTGVSWQESVAISQDEARIAGFKLALEYFDDSEPA